MDNELLMGQLVRHEGFSSTAYQDQNSFLTIGFGRLVDSRRKGGITRSEAIILLRNDISRIEGILSSLPYWDALNAPRQAVLVNMAFQLGVNGLLNFKNTLKLIESGNYEQAATEMLNSKWAVQTPNRAKELSEQMRSGIWQS